MKILLLILFFISCKSDRDRTVVLEEIGWSFELPSDFSFSDSAFNQHGHIDKSLWDTSSVDSRLSVQLFWIRAGKNNYFNTVIYIDSSDYKKWSKGVLAHSKLYIALITETPKLRLLDTLVSVENIDGVNLQKEYIKVYNTETKDTSYSYMFSRKYKYYSLHMNIQYTDKQFGEKLINILNSSKFVK